MVDWQSEKTVRSVGIVIVALLLYWIVLYNCHRFWKGQKVTRKTSLKKKETKQKKKKKKRRVVSLHGHGEDGEEHTRRSREPFGGAFEMNEDSFDRTPQRTIQTPDGPYQAIPLYSPPRQRHQQIPGVVNTADLIFPEPVNRQLAFSPSETIPSSSTNTSSAAAASAPMESPYVLKLAGSLLDQVPSPHGLNQYVEEVSQEEEGQETKEPQSDETQDVEMAAPPSEAEPVVPQTEKADSVSGSGSAVAEVGAEVKVADDSQSSSEVSVEMDTTDASCAVLGKPRTVSERDDSEPEKTPSPKRIKRDYEFRDSTMQQIRKRTSPEGDSQGENAPIVSQ